ncbi:MAG: tRNA guanosine(34) transglycosylase Tgt, partial [Bacteroidetes bacterium]|nr:tRNA guanosine(34) transglycosylase Tgt [Bacteroidota bacterium]
KTCFELIDPGLDHYAAQTFTKAYLRHLTIANEPLFMEIASTQNLAFYLWLMAEMRTAITEGRFADWRNEWTDRVSRRL